jgi:hypothetical protein
MGNGAMTMSVNFNPDHEEEEIPRWASSSNPHPAK